jgi:hypothetical protein
MAPTHTPPFGPDFIKTLIPQTIQAFDDATVRGYRMIWDIFMVFLAQNYFWVIVSLIMVLGFAFLEYLVTGRWANLGSVLYSYIYYGILFLIGLFFGPEIFANVWIGLILFVVYLISFFWVRGVLNNTGIRRS